MEGGNGVMMKEDKDQLTNLLERFSPDVESVKQICQQSNSQSLHEPELNLQLSLGINFEGETHLTRASSVAELMTQRKGSGEGEGEVFSFERSCSLPAERKQEHGHGFITLRELQARRRMRAMRRMQAKNRLLERQRISKENKEKEKSKASLKEPMPPLPAAEMATWAPASLAKTPLPYQATVNIKAKEDLAESKKGMYFPPPSPAPASAHGRKGSAAPNQPKLHKYPTGPEGSAAPNQPSKFHPSLDQRNVEPIQPSKFHPPADPRKVVPNQPSRFHSSSDPRNIETNQTSRFHPPSDQSNIERNQSSKFHPPSDPRNVVTNQLSRFHSSSDPRNIETNQTSRFHQPSDPRCIEPMTSPGTTLNGMLVRPAEAKPENQCKRPGIISGNFENNGIDVMKLMPSVTTTGDGPNGKRIEGFLYTYTKDQVCIVCICHGSFLSPAEFVKHAGGKDVQNPMKHITVHSALSAQGQR